MHPAEHRGLRELHAATRQLVAHWDALAGRLEAGGAPEPAAALRAGVTEARALLAGLEPLTLARDLPGRPAAQGLGRTIAGSRAVLTDRLLERNQALRLAVHDVQHLTTLLPYLAGLARRRDDEELAAFLDEHDVVLQEVERRARVVAVEESRDPDRAISPADPSPAGRAGHRLGELFGTIGEAVDRRARRR
jgi:hypothetical protein